MLARAARGTGAPQGVDGGRRGPSPRGECEQSRCCLCCLFRLRGGAGSRQQGQVTGRGWRANGLQFLSLTTSPSSWRESWVVGGLNAVPMAVTDHQHLGASFVWFLANVPLVTYISCDFLTFLFLDVRSKQTESHKRKTHGDDMGHSCSWRLGLLARAFSLFCATKKTVPTTRRVRV